MNAPCFVFRTGLKGDLTISDAMDNMMAALYFEKIPPTWEKKSYPTLRSLTPWVLDVINRCNQLADWTGGAHPLTPPPARARLLGWRSA